MLKCSKAVLSVLTIVSVVSVPVLSYAGTNGDFNTVHTLGSGLEEVSVNNNYDIQVFCRKADRKSPFYFFRSATLRIFSAAEDIKLFKGPDPQEVFRQYHSSTWLFWVGNLMPWRMRDANFPTFNSSCVGISTNQPYVAKLVLRYADPWKVFLFSAGVVLFFMSAKLAKSTTFFYSSATLVGALGAALLLVYLLSKFMPRGRGSYFTITVLYSMFLYFAGEAWNRFENLMQEKLPYVIVYLSLGAVVSLISCYRFGPPQNLRTLNIIQWSLQIFGLALIHLSSDLVEVSTCVIIIFIAYNFLSEAVMRQTRRIMFKVFPPKRKFLTEEEFITQGAVETQKSLEELRKFCNSPECNAWKIVSRLRNPKRFSGFMEGSSHLEDDELMAYESENEALEEAAAADLLTDDDEISEDD